MTNPVRSYSRLLLSNLLLGFGVFTLSVIAQEKPAATGDIPRYKDATLPVADRVADLLPRMTLEEKVYQLTGGWDNKIEVIDPTGTFTTETARTTLSAEWGPEVKFTPRQTAILRNGVQRYLREEDAPRHSGAVSWRGSARLHGVRQHQLSAGAGAGQHLGPGAGEARVHRRRR